MKKRIPWNKGKALSEKHKKKISEAEKINAMNNPNFGFRGKHHSKETKEKISKSLKIFTNKPDIKAKMSQTTKKLWQNQNFRKKMKMKNSGMQGRKHSEETKKKMSKAHKGQKRNREYRENISKGQRGKVLSEEHRKKLSIAFEKRIKDSNYPRNYLCPNFNFKSILIFKLLDKILYTRSRYGGTKAGEKKIGKYFMDFFNKKFKIIVEWNEPNHYNNDGNLSEYDVKKRAYVTAIYPDYTYIIIKQSDWLKSKELVEKIKINTVSYILSKIIK